MDQVVTADVGEPAAAAMQQILGALTDSLPENIMRSLGDESFTELLQVVSRVKNLADAVMVSMVHELRSRCSRTGESLTDKLGFKGEADYLQAQTQMSRAQATAHLRLAASVGRDCTPTGHVTPAKFEHVAAALRRGDMPLQSAQIIAKTLEGARSTTAEETEYAEKCLVEGATGLSCETGRLVDVPRSADSVRVMCTAWSQVLDQDGNEPKDEANLARRSLRLGTAQGGLVPIRGELLPEVAAMLGRLTDAINNPRVAEDPAADRRTYANKMHDAFATVVNVAAKAPDIPNLGGAPVTVLIQASEERLDTGGAWIQDHHGHMSPVTPRVVRHAACSGTLQRYVETPKGRIIELESPSRTFTANQRKVIVARDGGCVIPGCTTSSAWCEVHHVTPHAHGGSTHTDNGVLLCWHHHRTLDSNGWQIRIQDGVPQVKAPRWVPGPPGWVVAKPNHKIPPT